MLSRVLPRVAAASLLALSLAACSGDDDKDAKSPEQKAWEAQVDPDFVVGTREKPESVGGCKTSLQITFPSEKENEATEAIYPAAVLKDGTLTLWVSDQELDLDKLPASPRKDESATFATISVAAKGTGKKAERPAQGDRIQLGKKKSPFSVEVRVAKGAEETTGEDASGQIALVELGEKSGQGVCARIRYSDSEIAAVGTVFAALVADES